MRYLLSLTLGIAATLCATGCAGPNLQGYSIVRASAPLTADTSCRLLADEGGAPRSFCVSAARWAQYDKWAASAGVTCDQMPVPSKNQPREACLTAGQWRQLRYGPVSVARSVWDGGIPGGSYLAPPSNPVTVPGGMGTVSTSSYGPFPSGGAIGQTFP